MEKPRNRTESSVYDTEALLEHRRQTSFQSSYRVPSPSGTKHQARSIVIGFFCGLVLTSIMSTFLFTFSPYRSRRGLDPVPTGNDPIRKTPSAWYNGECGNSSVEALGRNCHFDVVSFSWLPPACQTADDLADEAEFMTTGPWRWFVEDGDLRREIFETEVRKGEFNVVFTSWEWHVTHCVFLWRKLHRALLSGGEVDTYMRSYEHTTHCGDMLLMEKPGGGSETSIFAKFPTCRG